MELLSVDVEEQHQGAVMQELGTRKGDLADMQPATAAAACGSTTASRRAA